MGRVQNYINSHTTKQKPYDGGGLCCDSNRLLNSASELPLRLLFNDIVNVPVPDASDVNDWNTFLTGNFTSVTISGNEVLLYGGSNIELSPSLFDSNEFLISIIDDAMCVIEIKNDVFTGTLILTTVKLNAVIDVGDSTFLNSSSLTTVELKAATQTSSTIFRDCLNLTSVDLRSCTDLGGTVLDNSVFLNISGNAFTLTIPSALMTCNSGNPDGDIDYLQTNNTVTIITV